MTRYQELQAAIRESNKGVHYLKQDHETFHVESLCAEIDQLRARVADLENDLEKSKHEADKARLAYVIANGPPECAFGEEWHYGDYNSANVYETPEAAIDAARKGAT